MYVFDRGVALYYVDPDDGSDTNSGDSPGRALKTIDTAVTKTRHGDWVLLRRGTRFFTHLSVSAPYRHFGTYGQGAKPIIDGGTAITGGWTQHGTFTNVWYADVTMRYESTGDYANIRSSAWHPGLWDEGDADTNETAAVSRRLRNDPGVGAGASQEDILAIVNAEPNTFCLFKQGSSHAEPRDASQRGVEWRVYLHTRDGSNPNTNGRTVSLAEDQSVLIAGEGQKWNDIVFQRSGFGNIVGVHGGTTKTEIFKGCEFLEVGFHACVVGGVTFEDCIAKATGCHNDPRTQGAGAYHQYRSEVSGTGTGFQVKNCYASGFAFAVYTHGGPDIQHERYEVDGFEAVNCTNIFGGSSRRGIVARRVKAYGCGSLCSAAIVLDDSELYLTDSICVFHGPSTRRTLLRNCFVTGFEYLFYPTTTTAFDDPDNRPTLELENCTLYNDRKPQWSYRWNINATLKNSIVAGCPDLGGNLILDSESTYEKLWDAAGTYQSIEITITEDDVIWINAVNNRTVSYSGTDNGDGTASLSVNFNNRTFGTWIKVPNGNGPGEDYQGRIISNGSSSSDPLIVSPPPAASFSNVVFQVPVFKHYLCRDPITATISEDGTQLRVPDGRFFAEGTAIRVGNLGSKPYGLRYVTEVAGSILTLNKPCEWKFWGDPTAYDSLDGTTVTNRRPLPTVELSFGFPINRRRTDSVEYPKITVTTPGGNVLWMRQQNTNTTSEFQTWSATVVPRLGTRYLPDGTDRPRAQYRGGIQHELGYWELGLAGMGIGDTIKFEYKIEIEEEKVKFDFDPNYLRRYLPSHDSLPFQRQAGYRG